MENISAEEIAVIERQQNEFANRLLKRYKHLGKWARRTGVSCFRLYDKDIPEIPLAVDLYQSEDEAADAPTESAASASPSAASAAAHGGSSAPSPSAQADGGDPRKYLHIALYERPYHKEEEAELFWLGRMKQAAQSALNVAPEHVFVKFRKRQRGEAAQYTKLGSQSACITVREGGLRFKVNLSDYLDTGLFFDHRPLRGRIMAECAGKDVLNLFCYTGAFSCYAAAGGANSVDSVDLSNTYLEWAKDNFALNGIGLGGKLPPKGAPKYRFIQEDAARFIIGAAGANPQKAVRCRWDVIILDPPTFSNSKRLKTVFDVNRHWAELANAALKALKPGGALYFSTNSAKLKFDAGLLDGYATDISAETIPEDFRNKRIHRCWRIT